MTTFSDCDLFTLHIPPQPKKNSGTCEVEIQTSPILASDSGTQTIIAVESGTQTTTEFSVGTSSEDQKSDDNDFPNLNPFLDIVSNKMESEILHNCSSTVFKNYPESSSVGFGMVTQKETAEEYQILPIPTAALGLQCTGVGWNASGSLLIATFGRSDISGWCSHGGVLAGWSLFRRDFDPSAQPEVLLEHSSCLMSLACHPETPYLCAAGSYNGEVLVVDMSSSETIETRLVSQIDDYFHREPVRSLKWVWDAEENEYVVASASSDGKVLWWRPRHQLKFPIRGSKLSLQRQSDGLRGLGLLNSAVHGATSITFTYANGKPEMSSTMVVGSEAGAVFALQPSLPAFSSKDLDSIWDDDARKLLRCVDNETSRETVRSHVERWAKLNNQPGKISPETLFRSKPDPDLLFNAGASGRTRFEPHAGPVLSVDASPFHRNLFASAGADGVVKISTSLQARPLLCLDPNAGHQQDGGLGGVLHGVSWSKTRPLVLGVGSALGHYSIFDLGKSASLPMAQIDKGGSRSSPVFCSSFNHKIRSFLALGREDGSVTVYRLSSAVTDASPNEADALHALVSNLSGSADETN
mmetsp:Transcript_30551/g.36037  ORF Transcript_30551/g.36037 Transcript_30551/m.36037 type:complete len:583 (+) Transcript_30551:1-1749(+)